MSPYKEKSKQKEEYPQGFIHCRACNEINFRVFVSEKQLGAVCNHCFHIVFTTNNIKKFIIQAKLFGNIITDTADFFHE